VAWAARLGFRDWSALAIADDLVIGSNGTGKGGVFAVDAATGKLRWRTADGNASSAAPVTDGTHAYFALGRPETLAAFRNADGRRAWSKPFAFVDDGEPVLVDGLLIAQSEDGFLYAFDAATGAERWKTQYARKENWCGAGRPAVAGGVVYIASGLQPPAQPRSDYFLHAIDAKTGRELWRYVPLSEYPNNYGACLTELLAVGDTIVGVSNEYLYGVDRATGRELYRVDLLDPDGRRRKMLGLVQLDGYVYGMSERVFRAVEARTGRTVWSLPGEYRDQSTGTAVADGLVYFQGRVAGVDTGPDTGGILHALDPRTRRLQWSFTYRTDEPWAFGSPVVENGAVYVATYGTLLKLAK
jgi:outer membrane protein assembly factor BamB